MGSKEFLDAIADAHPRYSVDFVLCVDELTENMTIEDAEIVCEMLYGWAFFYHVIKVSSFFHLNENEKKK